MLVLSRKKDEKIVIGDSITLMVIEIRGDKVRLGIEAPRDVKVVRGELKEECESLPVSTHKMESRPITLRDFAATVLPLQRQVG